jgi:hypothetical protein
MLKSKKYILNNIKVYDNLAEEYGSKHIQKRLNGQRKVIKPFTDILIERFKII